MKLRVLKKEFSTDMEKDADITFAAESAIKILKKDPMIIGEPFAEVSPGCPMGFAKAKIVIHYNLISPSTYDKIKLFFTGKSVQDVIRGMKKNVL